MLLPDHILHSPFYIYPLSYDSRSSSIQISLRHIVKLTGIPVMDITCTMVWEAATGIVILMITMGASFDNAGKTSMVMGAFVLDIIPLSQNIVGVGAHLAPCFLSARPYGMMRKKCFAHRIASSLLQLMGMVSLQKQFWSVLKHLFSCRILFLHISYPVWDS